MARSNAFARQTASEYRSRAEQCEWQAAKTKEPGEKAHFLELVRVYRILAQKTAELEGKRKRVGVADR
jgi:hypothetical protein